MTSQRPRLTNVSRLVLQNSQPQGAALGNFPLRRMALASTMTIWFQAGLDYKALTPVCTTTRRNHVSAVSLPCGTKQRINGVSIFFSISEGDSLFKNTYHISEAVRLQKKVYINVAFLYWNTSCNAKAKWFVYHGTVHCFIKTWQLHHTSMSSNRQKKWSLRLMVYPS